MQIDPDELSIRDFYSWMVHLITPRPIAWVSTISSDGVGNLAPFSFFNGVGANPPTLMFCPANDRRGQPKDTLANIRETGEFVVNVVTEKNVRSMNLTAAPFAPHEDEFEHADIAKLPSLRIKPPRVADAVAAFECQLYQAIQIGHGPGGANVVIGRIVQLHIADEIYGKESEPAMQIDTVGRMGGPGYVKTTDRFDLPRPSRPE